jgi:hypothetical protein
MRGSGCMVLEYPRGRSRPGVQYLGTGTALERAKFSD